VSAERQTTANCKVLFVEQAVKGKLFRIEIKGVYDKMKTMEKAVIYARYSSDRQTEQSIEGQLRECEQYANKNGYQVIATYIDRALSGKMDA
jgi:predicted site-specific integrase-resolvase